MSVFYVPHAKEQGMRNAPTGHEMPDIGWQQQANLEARANQMPTPPRDSGSINRSARLLNTQAKSVNARLIAILRSLRIPPPAPPLDGERTPESDHRPLSEVMEVVEHELNHTEVLLNDLETYIA